MKLPPAPAGDYARAFIGARIGRAKTRPNANRPWIRELIDGKVYMGISDHPAFTSEQSFFLVEATDLPREADPQSYVDGVGSAEWFWTEVPLSHVSFDRSNYLVIWSPTKYFVRASSSPILAAAAIDEGNRREVRAWNNHSISGVPPRVASGALETPLYNLAPALAIKLVPQNKRKVIVLDLAVERKDKRGVVAFGAAGENVDQAWVESSRDQLEWQRISPIARRQPFVFTIGSERFPGPGSFLRGVAQDILGNVGNSATYAIPYGPR